MSNRDQWHEVRSKGIGGSEITSILGLNPYETPYALWEKKTGRVQRFEGNKFTVAGNYLEPVVAQMFEDQGFECYGGGDNHYAHPTHPFCIGTPDRFVKGKHGDAVLEIKTTQKSVDKQDIPVGWYFQDLWYQGITGKKRGYIAWLSRGIDFDFVEIEYNAEIFEEMIEQATNFWNNHVLADVAPPPLKKEDIIKIVGKVHGAVELSEEAALVYHQIKENAKAIKELEEVNDELLEAIQLAMMEKELATWMGATLFTWKESTVNRLDQTALKEQEPEIYARFVKQTSQRTFRIK